MKSSLLLLSLLCLSSLPSSAQDAEAWTGAPIHFDTPGVRSLSMGATTVAVTNEPSLASSNPASLASIDKPTLAAEYRTHQTSARFYGDVLRSHLTAQPALLGSATVVLPLRGLTWAVFYDEPLATNVGSEIPSESGIAGHIDTHLRRYGVGAAWKRGNLSAGAAVHYDTLQLTSTRYTTISVDTTAVSFVDATRADDTALAWNAGVQWRAMPDVTLGAVYARGSRFYAVRTAIGPFGLPATFFWPYNTPSSLGAGAAWNAASNLTFAADAVRINYQEMTPQVLLTGGMPPTRMHAATELHAGAEYRLAPHVALRAGWWRDPAHGPAVFTMASSAGLAFAEALQPDREDDHVTAGIGIGTDRVRFDAAYDHGQRTRRASFGVVTTF